MVLYIKPYIKAESEGESIYYGQLSQIPEALRALHLNLSAYIL